MAASWSARGAVQPLRHRHRQPVGRHDHGVGDPRGGVGEVRDQPVEVAGVAAELCHLPPPPPLGRFRWTLAGVRASGDGPPTLDPGAVAGQHAADLVRGPAGHRAWWWLAAGLLAGHHPRRHVGPWHPPWQAGLGHLGRRFGGGGWRRGLGHRRRARRLVHGRLGRPRWWWALPAQPALGSVERGLLLGHRCRAVGRLWRRPGGPRWWWRWGGRTAHRAAEPVAVATGGALALPLGQRAGIGGLADEPVGAGRLEDRGGVAGPVWRRLVQPRLGRPLRRWRARPGRGPSRPRRPARPRPSAAPWARRACCWAAGPAPSPRRTRSGGAGP